MASFEKIVAAHEGHGERVDRPADLPAALRRAAASVRGGQQALVNVICPVCWSRAHAAVSMGNSRSCAAVLTRRLAIPRATRDA